MYLLYMATRWRNFTTNGPILKAGMSPLCINCMYVFKQYRKATILNTSFFSKLEKWLALRVLHCSGGLAAEVLTSSVQVHQKYELVRELSSFEQFIVQHCPQFPGSNVHGFGGWVV